MTSSYVDFENRFRGSSATVRDEQAPYVACFAGVPGPVVDLGCGRGEFLDLMREAGQAAYGVEQSAEMRAACPAGVDVRAEDIIAHLVSIPAASLGGVFMAHVIEHLPRPDVLRLVDLAATRLAPGGRLVVETLNPQCVLAAAPFWMDFSHCWPVHPQTLTFLLEAHGFGAIETRYRQYLPDDMLVLPQVPVDVETPLTLAFGEAMVKLQRILDLAFRNFIYAVVATRLPEDAPSPPGVA